MRLLRFIVLTMAIAGLMLILSACSASNQPVIPESEALDTRAVYADVDCVCVSGESGLQIFEKQ